MPRTGGESTIEGRQTRPIGALLRLLRCRSGAAGAEFAIVIVPFLGLLFFSLNIGLVFLAQQTLQTATSQAARLIMTGQAQQQGLTAGDFQQAVCTNATSLFTCSGITVNVRTFSSFTNVAMLNPVSNGAVDPTKMGYTPGNPGDIVVVQAFYQWPLFATLFGYNFSNLSGGLDLLVATAAFRNEPYQ
jgi:Flp pilus assembly protein TadG